MKELSFERMEKIQGGASFWGCIGGSAFTVGIFVAAAVAAATVITAGGAAVAIIGLYGGIGLSCLT